MRVAADEQMDDVGITDARLTGALDDLWWTNRLLGGWAATDAVLDPLLRTRDSLRLLDLGTGGGDMLVHLVRRGAAFGCRVEATGVDLNPAALDYAERQIRQHLPPTLQDRITLMEADALALDAADDAFDVAHAALFLHHFHGPDAPALLREMQRVSRLGAVVNDLHRHPLAYVGIGLLSRLLPTSSMYRHDAPLSVRRGFRRSELHALARRADWPQHRIRWHWAFRYTLSSLPAE